MTWKKRPSREDREEWKTKSKEQMQEAFAVMQEQFVPMEVTVSEIGLAKTNPHQDLVRIELND